MLHRLAESIPRNRFLGPLNVYKYGSVFSKPLYSQGRVYAVNESTLYVEGFSYDGTGEEARFYAGRAGEEGTLLSPSGEPAAVLEQLENRNLYLR